MQVNAYAVVSQILIHAFSGLLCEFELNWAARFLLTDRRPVRCIASRHYIFDPDADKIERLIN